jgi:hypothetical protein
MTAREREECLDLFWKPSSTRGKGARNRVPREMKAGNLIQKNVLSLIAQPNLSSCY